MPTEITVSLPVSRRRKSGAVAKVETMVEAVMIVVMMLSAPTEAPNSTYMSGQAEPNSASGRPIETKQT